MQCLGNGLYILQNCPSDYQLTGYKGIVGNHTVDSTKVVGGEVTCLATLEADLVQLKLYAYD